MRALRLKTINISVTSISSIFNIGYSCYWTVRQIYSFAIKKKH